MFSYIFERLEVVFCPSLSDSRYIMPSKKDGFTQVEGPSNRKKWPPLSITKFIYLVMRSIFCRRAWWKVGCTDWVSSHIDSSWKKCRSRKWLKLSQGMRLTLFCAGDGWGNWEKELHKQHMSVLSVKSKTNPTPRFTASKRNPLLQMRVQVSKGHHYAN